MNEAMLYAGTVCALVRSAIDKTPAELPEKIEIERLVDYAKRHALVSLMAQGMLDNKIQVGPGIAKRLLSLIQTNRIFKKLRNSHKEAVRNAFEDAGIENVILKGEDIDKFYPEPDLRESCDCDIYVGTEYMKQSREIMKNLGFEMLEEGLEHDEYEIDGLVVFEIHNKFAHEEFDEAKECKKILKRLRIKEGKKHTLYMTDEDIFFYMVCHTAKHFKQGGIGLKNIVDLWVLKNRIDTKQAEKYIKNANLSEIYNELLALADFWLEGKELPEKYRQDAEEIAQGTWRGTAEKNKENMEKRSFKVKLKNLVKMYNFPRYLLEDRYPILKKAPYLLPFCRIHRAITSKNKDIMK